MISELGLLGLIILGSNPLTIYKNLAGLLISLTYLISAFGLLHLKNWARLCVIMFSGFHLLYGIKFYIDFLPYINRGLLHNQYLFNKTVFFVLLLIVVQIFILLVFPFMTIIYFIQPKVKDQFRSKTT